MPSNLPDVPFDNAIELDQVHFRRNDRTIIPSASFQVGRGEHWVMLGANGAGKSTLLSFCGAMAHPTSGTVKILGHQLGRVELRALRQLIGHVNPRHPIKSAMPAIDVVLTGLTGSVEKAMRWEPTEEQRAQAQELLETFGLGHKADYRWPTLSQGERGRVLIARSLMAQPELL